MVDEIVHLVTEMNRGFLQVLVLVLLEQPMYGYMMSKHLEKIGYSVEENTLYPLLRRLEKNSFIQGEWSVSEGRPKKFYTISPRGVKIREKLIQIWRQQNSVLEAQLREEKNV